TPVFELALEIFSSEAPAPPATESESEYSLIGSTIDGRYVVERRLAIGGMSRVYLARDLTVDPKRVVVKVLLEEALRNEEIVRKFQSEKRALALVAHPGVVAILDAGELPDKKPYL